MEEWRRVHTTQGGLDYLLCRKRIKNFYLRIDSAGQVSLSAPSTCTPDRADRFVRERQDWVLTHLQEQEERRCPLLPKLDQEACLEVLRQALDRVYPLVQPLGVVYPLLKLRRMKSQWGNCYWNRGCITLNTALGRCPEELRDYVALHELVHFLHHDHGPGFCASMDGLMPDWRKRRQALRGYGAALEQD